jgi:hypothetical protein
MFLIILSNTFAFHPLRCFLRTQSIRWEIVFVINLLGCGLSALGVLSANYVKQWPW